MIQRNATWNLAAISHKGLIKGSALTDSYEYLYEPPNGRPTWVYVLDSGIRADHEEFLRPNGDSRIEAVYDATNGRFGKFNLDHGTHVAGVIGGLKYGVAKNTTFVDVRIAGEEGLDSASVANGLRWAVESIIAERRELYSCIHMGAETGPDDEAVASILKRAHREGISVVVAAGNQGQKDYVTFPGKLRQPTTVSAFDKTYTRMQMANTGSKVDILAPGVDIKAASARATNAYSFRSGTSAAAAHVSGFIVYFQDVYGGERRKEMWTQLRRMSREYDIFNQLMAPDRRLYNGNDMEELPDSVSKLPEEERKEGRTK